MMRIDFSAISICFVAVRFDIALNKHILCVCGGGNTGSDFEAVLLILYSANALIVPHQII